MNDKKVERSRYDDRALKLLSKGSFDKDTGSSSYSLPIRTPYLRYEEMHIEFIDNNDNVLEIGAGTGIHTHSLLETGAFVVATDISTNSLQIIKKKYKEYSDKLSTKVADMESLPFDNETFDVVCSAGSLSYGDNQIVMNEIHRVLKPGGKLLTLEGNQEGVDELNQFREAYGLKPIPVRWHNRFLKNEEYISFMKENGMKLVDEGGLGTYFFLTRGVRGIYEENPTWQSDFNKIANQKEMADLLGFGHKFSRVKLWVFQK